ncbi:MAG: hypothetical protein M0Z35_19815 [Desulfitobacterium hafniense]|nr:hypothetical protein [Desulfitobacterium hafniense]
MSTKSTTLYLGDNRLSIRLSIELWRQLGKYTLASKENKGNTLMIDLLTKNYGITNLAEIHNKLVSAKYDPGQSKSGNTIVVDLLTEYFKANPVK